MLLDTGTLTVMTGGMMSTATDGVAVAMAQIDVSARQTEYTEHLQHETDMLTY